ncbi:glycosyltransferase [Bacillus benzoevorans]|uniref:Glycosyltransferase involved in cell wall biosynthesis n=1 Tax=Bacillus benzoevorans TaxID=1456 RepID=A0A7X0HVF5_9BACI|nr:glycosyltransferase [Bacillus benzoevorans]MBB6447579.1 glycosyltransferase involved in cell wall biosynthesis [Bacillus benzoevorans]
MNIAFVGTLVNPEIIMKYSGGSIAGNKYQFGITSQLGKNNKLNKFIILPYASFPRTKKIFISSRYLENKYRDGYVVPYLNIFGLKQILCSINLTLMLGKWALKTRKEKNRVILIYNTMSFMCIPVLLISTFFNIKKVAIIADLPPKFQDKFSDKLEAKFEINSIKKFNGIVQITKHIVDDFAPGMQNIIIEGGGFGSKSNLLKVNRNNKIILYTGALDDNSGIEILLESFKRLKDEDARLIIAGKGKFEGLVSSYERSDNRINYLGYITNEEAVNLQNEANILVCPRIPDGYVTKYTFPSKIMEYLLTGNKVICFSLEGIPKEYNEYIIFPKENSILGLLEVMANTLSLPHQINQKQIEFIKKKCWENNSKNVLDFLEGIVENDEQ